MKIKLAYILLGLASCHLMGCQKTLDTLPKDSKVAEIIVLDQATAQIALNGAYYTFANATRIKTDWQQHQTLPASLAGYLGYGYGMSPQEENRNEGINEYWYESYVLLNAVNGVITGINDLPDNMFNENKKSEMLGEAYFLRAYAHFKLLSYFAEWFDLDSPLGVLLRDELSTTSNITKPRSTVRESYDFILADLDNAVANAPDANAKHYATKYAAMVLKMRVLMSRGVDEDYAEVLELADQVLTGPYILEEKPQDIFHAKGLSSEEVILGIQPQAQQETDPYSKSAQYWPGAASLYVAKKALVDLLEDDPRLLWVVGGESAQVDYSPDTYYFTKYMRENVPVTQLSETDYAMRLTEVYLLKAEAIVRSEGDLDKAKELVHLIQSKAGVTETESSTHYWDVENAADAEALLIEIYKETVRSLVGEDGMEWMALLRLPLETVTAIKPTLTSTIQYILPVPINEFVYNPAFGDQNPGYSRN